MTQQPWALLTVWPRQQPAPGADHLHTGKTQQTRLLVVCRQQRPAGLCGKGVPRIARLALVLGDRLRSGHSAAGTAAAAVGRRQRHEWHNSSLASPAEPSPAILACRLGELLLRRPVAVAVWFQLQRTRGPQAPGCAAAYSSADAQPPAACCTQSASTHLLTKLASSR